MILRPPYTKQRHAKPHPRKGVNMQNAYGNMGNMRPGSRQAYTILYYY